MVLENFTSNAGVGMTICWISRPWSKNCRKSALRVCTDRGVVDLLVWQWGNLVPIKSLDLVARVSSLLMTSNIPRLWCWEIAAWPMQALGTHLQIKCGSNLSNGCMLVSGPSLFTNACFCRKLHPALCSPGTSESDGDELGEGHSERPAEEESLTNDECVSLLA